MPILLLQLTSYLRFKVKKKVNSITWTFWGKGEDAFETSRLYPYLPLPSHLPLKLGSHPFLLKSCRESQFYVHLCANEALVILLKWKRA